MNKPSVNHLLPFLALCTLPATSIAAPIPAVPTAVAPSTPAPPRTEAVYLLPDEKQPALTDGGQPTPGTDQYDFGARSAAQATPIEHTFLLRNASPTPLTVDHIQPSCGCTTALADGAAGTAPTVIAPGAQLKVHVAVDPAHLSAGQIIKTVWVFLKGQAGPAATLQVIGTVRAAASFAPGIINFGQVRAGATPALAMTVTLDPALAPAAPRLASSDPDVLVTAQPEPAGASTRAYSVSLSPKAHLGVLNGSLTLVSANGGPVAGGGAFDTVPIIGTVVGDVTASPASLAFGSVAAGQAVTLSVTLTGATPNALRSLKASALGPFIAARLSPESAASARTLEVSVSPQAPPGTIQTEVTVTTAKGQRLVVPIFVYITKENGGQ